MSDMDVTIILTVHNQERLMRRVVGGIFASASPCTTRLIAIFDGCTDESEAVFSESAGQSNREALEVECIRTPDIWETKANNVGLRECDSRFACIIQDDMVLTERHFDRALIEPMLRLEEVFAVSGRSAANDYFDKNGNLRFRDVIGRENPAGSPRWLQKARERLRIPSAPRPNLFGVRDVVNRGPLMLDMARVRELGYFDEAFAPLDLDDHDLCIRAKKAGGWLCGSYPVGYLSDLDWGGTRSNPISHQIWQESHNKNKQILLDRHGDFLTQKKHNQNIVIERPLSR